MSDECGTMSAERDGTTEAVEMMMTADGLRLTAYSSIQIDAPGLER